MSGAVFVAFDALAVAAQSSMKEAVQMLATKLSALIVPAVTVGRISRAAASPKIPKDPMRIVTISARM